MRLAVEEVAVRRKRKLEDRHDEALRVRVVVAARVAEERTERRRVHRAVDLVLAGEELGERHDAARRVTRGRIDREDRVDGLDHQAVAFAEALVGRCVARLVAVVGGPLILERHSRECGRAGIRARDRRRLTRHDAGRSRLALRARDVAVDFLAGFRPQLVLRERGVSRIGDHPDDPDNEERGSDRDQRFADWLHSVPSLVSQMKCLDLRTGPSRYAAVPEFRFGLAGHRSTSVGGSSSTSAGGSSLREPVRSDLRRRFRACISLLARRRIGCRSSPAPAVAEPTLAPRK